MISKQFKYSYEISTKNIDLQEPTLCSKETKGDEDNTMWLLVGAREMHTVLFQIFVRKVTCLRYNSFLPTTVCVWTDKSSKVWEFYSPLPKEIIKTKIYLPFYKNVHGFASQNIYGDEPKYNYIIIYGLNLPHCKF